MKRGILTAMAAVVATGCMSTPSSAPRAPAPPSSAEPTSATPRPHLQVRRTTIRLSAPIAREAVVVDGEGFVVAGGLRAGDTSTAAAFRVDLRAGTSIRLPDLPIPVHDTAGALANGAPLVVGGGNSAEQDTVQAWDGVRWRVLGHLPQARSDLVAATVGGRVVVLGGYDGTRPAEPDILSSFDGRHWSAVGRLPRPVRYAACAVADGAIWLFGGEVDGTMRTAIQRIDPDTGMARIVGHLPRGLGHAAAVPLSNRVLIVGGRTGLDSITNQMLWFDPATRTVRRAGRLPEPLADAGAALVGQTAYILGGETPALSRQVLAITYR